MAFTKLQKKAMKMAANCEGLPEGYGGYVPIGAAVAAITGILGVLVALGGSSDDDLPTIDIGEDTYSFENEKESTSDKDDDDEDLNFENDETAKETDSESTSDDAIDADVIDTVDTSDDESAATEEVLNDNINYEQFSI